MILLRKDHIFILTSASKGVVGFPAIRHDQVILTWIAAKIFAQLQNSGSPVPIQILTLAKPKEPPTDALPKLLDIHCKLKRVGALTKENLSGKVIDEWNKLVNGAEHKPEIIDLSPAISSLLAVKDDDELVCQ